MMIVLVYVDDISQTFGRLVLRLRLTSIATLPSVLFVNRSRVRQVMSLRWCLLFSSRRRHTIFDCDWSSDVCSSDLGHARPHERRPEGPFGDHYGYYSLQHDYPVFHCDAIAHRRDAIYPATVVGKPRQEDFFIGDYLQSLLSPIFPLVMPGVRDLWSYGETGFHSLAAAVVRSEERRVGK